MKKIFIAVLVILIILATGCNNGTESIGIADLREDIIEIKDIIKKINTDIANINNDIIKENNDIAKIRNNLAEINNNITENSSINDKDEYIVSAIDYPLIDISIRYNEAEIKLIIANNVLMSDEGEYLFTSNKEVLEEMQCILNVCTFPEGHGTTPDSCIYVYQDNVLIKEIPFLGIYNNDGEFDLIRLSKEDIEKSIGQSLPSPI